jgi:hypothetical protein
MRAIRSRTSSRRSRTSPGGTRAERGAGASSEERRAGNGRDAKAAGIAHELFVRWGIVAGVERAHTMGGGYRGMIKIEPAVPVGENRHHLEWVAGAIRDFDVFFAELEQYRLTRP